ncbi:MAG: phosphoribosylamine--glycine ligase [Oceanococcus sp.]
MKLLVVGGGGREHALAWKLAQSERVSEVLVAPGNAGTATEACVRNVAVAAEDIEGLLSLVAQEAIDLVVVGPEAPLAAGLVDRLQAAGVRAFGPSQAAAELEASKAFTKDFLARHNIPTAAYGNFTEVEPALAYLATMTAPFVIKADGLAAGKGVIVTEQRSEAEAAVRDMLEGNSFGDAGHRVVVEEFLHGEEASFIALVDGENVLALASSQDHKRVFDGDQGPNTGGMGAYSPAPVLSEELIEKAMQDVMLPTVRGMATEGRRFVGFLYAGLMISPQGETKVVEFNVRMGDPETQPILFRLQSDLLDAIEAAVDGRLNEVELQWDERCSVGVVLAAGGYPGDYPKGDIISGLDTDFGDDVKVFHAGTKLQNNDVSTAGGRVLCVCAVGANLNDAQSAAYAAIPAITWSGMQYRKDIGSKGLARLG